MSGLEGSLAAMGATLLVPAIATRVLFLASTRLGAIPHFANVVVDAGVKLGVPRSVLEGVPFAVGWGLLALAGPQGWVVGVGAVGIVVALELANRSRALRVLSDVYAHLDRRKRPLDKRAPSEPGTVPHPSPHPDLVVNLRGPFLRRLPAYDLGTIGVGCPVTITVLIGNHSIIDCQVAPTLTVHGDPGLDVSGPAEPLPRLAASDVHSCPITVVATMPGDRTLRLVVRHADARTEVGVRVRAVPTVAAIRSASISRYPGGCRAAFSWRGDMDHYDTSTFQSIDGLAASLELGRRYRIPQSLYISSRLCLVPEEAQAFYAHYGVNRGEEHIEEFIAWVNSNVSLVHRLTYPTQVPKRFSMELGNHGHLHFGTDAAAAEGNGWMRGARMGQGRYQWLTDGGGSFEEQRDNALETRRLFERLFGFSPKSWAMPDRTNDENTARAMEAAGCDVVSDSNVRARHNVLLQPPPHHPRGTQVVELTKRYPGDPHTIEQVAMNLYWIHRAWRRGIPVVFMCHQHLRQFEGYSCARFTEFLLRHALTRFNGDLYIDTVYGVGAYWKAVLSPQTRCVGVRFEGHTVLVSNDSTLDLADLPVDVELADGSRRTLLVSVAAGEQATVSLSVG